MHLDKDRRALESEKEKIVRDRVQYQSLQKQLPEMIRKKEAITAQLPKLESELAALNKKRLAWLKEQARVIEIIEQGKAAAEIRSELKNPVESLRKEILLKTEEIRKLIEPASVLNKSARDLEAMVTSQKNMQETFKNQFKHTTDKLQLAANTIGKEAIHLRANALNFAQSAKSTNAILDKAAEATQGAVKKISVVGKNLTKHSDTLNQQSDRFAGGLNTLDSEITGIQNIRKNLQSFSGVITRMDADFSLTINKLRALVSDSQGTLKQWQTNAQSLHELIRTIGLQKDAFAKASELLGSQISAISKTNDLIISETKDFRTKINNYSPSDTEKAIKLHEKKLSTITNKIESDADKIYNLNFSLEKELRKLIIESENFNKMLKSHQNELKKKGKKQ